jgi:polysaccharide export outer membrane protein
MSLRAVSFGMALLALGGCGVIYTAPGVHDGTPFGTAYGTALDVKVMPLTHESAAAANLETYVPARLPLAFQPGATAVLTGSAVRTPQLPVLPAGTARPTPRPDLQADEFPPLRDPEPYRIGVADVLLLAVNSSAALDDLPGLISAQSKRQGYIVQDDGAIAIPDAGRIRVANMTMQDAEAEIFRALAAAGIDPSFSLEIAEFNSQRVAVGGMVNAPVLVPLTLKPLYLHEAIELAGGIAADDPETTQVQLFRDVNTYRIGLDRFTTDPAARRIVLRDGDSIHVGSAYREAEAQLYFSEQLQLRQLQVQGTQFQLQIEQIRAQSEATAQERLSAERQLFKDRLELGAVERHYAYRAGEVRKPGRVELPFERSMSLADALFDEGGININFGDYGEIYVLRADTDPQRNGSLTAYHLNAENAVNLTVSTRFELRPNDIVFVAEQAVTSWNRTLSQILPQIFITAASTAGAQGGL